MLAGGKGGRACGSAAVHVVTSAIEYQRSPHLASRCYWNHMIGSSIKLNPLSANLENLKIVIPVKTGIQGALALGKDTDSCSPVKSGTGFAVRTTLRILTKVSAYGAEPTILW